MNRQIDSSSDIFRARESIRTMQRKVEEHNKERDNTGVRVNVRACLRGRLDDVIRTSTAVVPALPSESVPLPGPKERDNGRESLNKTEMGERDSGRAIDLQRLKSSRE